MTRAEKNKYARDYRKKHPEKSKAYQRKSYRKQNPEVKRVSRGFKTLREINLWRRFKLTQAQYDQMFSFQCGRCAICKEPEYRLDKNGIILPLSVDHNHMTGEIRKLLCGDCNTAIGLMDENILRLQSAIDYLTSGDRKGEVK